MALIYYRVQLLHCWNRDRKSHRAIGAPFDKGFHPIKSCLIVATRRRDEIVSLIFEQIYILLQRDTVLRAHVRLRRFVWSTVVVSEVRHKHVGDVLVHPENFFRVTFNNKVLEIVCLVPSP